VSVRACRNGHTADVTGDVQRFAFFDCVGVQILDEQVNNLGLAFAHIDDLVNTFLLHRQPSLLVLFDLHVLP
jgi:hypothetical protein